MAAHRGRAHARSRAAPARGGSRRPRTCSAIASATRVRLVFAVGTAYVSCVSASTTMATSSPTRAMSCRAAITIADANSGADLVFSARGDAENGTVTLVPIGRGDGCGACGSISAGVSRSSSAADTSRRATLADGCASRALAVPGDQRGSDAHRGARRARAGRVRRVGGRRGRDGEPARGSPRPTGRAGRSPSRPTSSARCRRAARPSRNDVVREEPALGPLGALGVDVVSAGPGVVALRVVGPRRTGSAAGRPRDPRPRCRAMRRTRVTA